MARPDLGAMMSGAEPMPNNRSYGGHLAFIRDHRPRATIRLSSGKRLRLSDGLVLDRNGEYPDDDWMYGCSTDAEDAEVRAIMESMGEVTA